MLSTRQLERDLEDGRTLLAAVRSGAVQSYTGIKRDWQRERNFERRFVDMKSVQQWNRKRAFASLVRSQFEEPIGEGVDAKTVRNQRIDAGSNSYCVHPMGSCNTLTMVCLSVCLAFDSLRDVDTQITMIRNLAEDGAFNPIVRAACYWSCDLSTCIPTMVFAETHEQSQVLCWRCRASERSGNRRDLRLAVPAHPQEEHSVCSCV